MGGTVQYAFTTIPTYPRCDKPPLSSMPCCWKIGAAAAIVGVPTGEGRSRQD